VRSRRLHALALRRIVERQHREYVERPGHVEQLRVGVRVHRQVQRAMSHRGLSRPRRDSALAQVRAERVPQAVNVERPAALVALVDAPAVPALPILAADALRQASGHKVKVETPQ
jgi:hypothetical protein